MRCTCKNSILYVYQTTSWFSICVGLHVYAGTADKANKQMIETSYLLCLQAVNAVPERHGNTVHTPKASRKRTEIVKCHPERHRNAVEHSANSVAMHWTRRGRREDGVRTSWLPLFTNNFLFLGILAAFWKI